MFQHKKDGHEKDDEIVKKAAGAEADETVESESDDSALAECQKKCAEYLSGWQRSQADYQNLVKETASRRQEWAAFAGLEILHGILPIYDHLKLAFTHIPAEQKKINWVVGIEHIKNQLKKFLENQGLEEIKTVGQKFDPALHEAVEHKDTHSTENTSADAGQVEEAKSSGKIIKKEISAGYKLNGKVIQAAKVII